MAASKTYAKGILEDIVQGEFQAFKKQENPDVDLGQVVKVNPKVEIKQSTKSFVYTQDDIVWGINPKSLKMDDVVIMNRDTSGLPIVVDIVDGKNPDPTGHPVGEDMYNDISHLKHSTASWKPYVQSIAHLPRTKNFRGDTRLVLDQNTLFRWNDVDNTWNATGSSISALAELLDVEITDPVAGQVLQWDGENWVNATIDLSSEDPTKLPLEGGTLTGDLVMGVGSSVTLPDAPVDPTDAVNKDYVDDAILSVISSPLLPTVSVSGNYAILPSDSVILVDSTTGPRIINLPASHTNGKVYYIKDKMGTAHINNITVQSDDADTIDGASNLILASPRAGISVVSDGTNWYVV